MRSTLLAAVPYLLAAQVAAAPLVERDGCPAAVTVTVIANAAPAAAATPYGEKYSPKAAASVQAVPAPQATQASADQGKYAPAANNSVPAPDHRNRGSYENSLYFTNWGIYGANYQPQQIPAKQVSRILFAFADIASDGEVKSSDSYADIEKHYPTDSWNDVGKNVYGIVKQLYLLKKQNRHMKVLLSIGGWTYSPKFPPVAATEAGRQRFASSAVKLVADWGFDGIDIDWEYPANPQEAQDYVRLLQTCRKALDDYAAKNAPGYHFVITVATPAGAKNYNQMDLRGMDQYVDAWNLMAYDYAGSWDSTSGHQANLFANPGNEQSTKYSTEAAVRDYVAKGIDVNKIMLGLPLYGRSFESTPGMGQTYNGVGQGSIQSGVWLHKDLPRAGAQEEFDDVAGASFSYDSGSKELISYDNLRSTNHKALYLKRKGMGGAVFWEASGDRAGEQSLVGSMAGQLGGQVGSSSQNLLSYPSSIYENLRAGMPGN